jgi:glucose-1-phosphate cytidylyltransferase
MKVVLFCGGLGMRMRDYSDVIPKPMVPIGYRPVLWHLMRYYAHFGHTDFVLCLGYRGDVIKDYFVNYREWESNDFVLSAGASKVEFLQRDIDEWRITFVDTGIASSIGERLQAVAPHLEGEETFLANYADGLADVHLPSLIDHFHRSRSIAALVAVQPRASFHVLRFDEADGRVREVAPATDRGMWINGGFFVFDRRIFDYMRPGEELVEEPFRRLIADGQLTSYRHDGFWAGMDTFKDREMLSELHQAGRAPWQVWGEPVHA